MDTPIGLVPRPIGGAQDVSQGQPKPGLALDTSSSKSRATVVMSLLHCILRIIFSREEEESSNSESGKREGIVQFRHDVELQ